MNRWPAACGCIPRTVRLHLGTHSRARSAIDPEAGNAARSLTVCLLDSIAARGPSRPRRAGRPRLGDRSYECTVRKPIGRVCPSRRLHEALNERHNCVTLRSSTSCIVRQLASRKVNRHARNPDRGAHHHPVGARRRGDLVQEHSSLAPGASPKRSLPCRRAAPRLLQPARLA
jgi:hypothetical protein